MLKNYLKIAFRHLRRQKGYAFLNVFGLAVGMSACLLIGLYVTSELSYDDFHENSDRLYVIGHETPFGRSTSTPAPLAPTLETSVPEVIRAVRTQTGSHEIQPAGQQETFEEQVLFVDSTFFEVFTFPLIRGAPTSVLDQPNGVVITRETAQTIFGDDDPVGRALTLQRRGQTHQLNVAGVAENVPHTSTIQFDVVVPWSGIGGPRTSGAWGASVLDSYVILNQPIPGDELTEKITAGLESHVSEKRASSFFARPLSSLYLSDLYHANGFRGQMRYIYIFGAVALFILLIAAINYVNLVTAQGQQRIREVGVRRTLGAGRWQVAKQFLGESVLLSAAALIVALLLTVLMLPAFNQLFGTQLTLSVQQHGTALLGLSAFVLMIGIAAGIYPAFVLSGFRPSSTLRAGTARVTSSGGWLRKGLIVLQFTVSTALIIATIVIHQQLDLMQDRHLGSQGDQVIVLPLQGNQARRVANQIERDLETHPGIERATLTTGLPGKFNITLGEKPENVSPRANTERETIGFKPALVDPDYLETTGLRLLAGRNFSPDRPSDKNRAYILNETAAEQMGWTVQEAVGNPFKVGPGAPQGEVIGVVEEFPVEALRHDLQPVALTMESYGWSSAQYVIAKVRPDRVREFVDYLQQVVQKYAPEASVEYSFLGDEFDRMYRAEIQLGFVFTTFAGLAILIACVGLFGLAAFAAQRRTREIGIRKVLGATVSSIITLLSRDFLKLVVLALILAGPIAYYATDRWLQEFAYRIDLGPGIFILAGIIAVIIAFFTVSYQSMKAALTNPADSLRYE